MRRKNRKVSPRRALVALLALGLALVVLRAPWSDAPRAESQRAASSRKGVLGGADYLIEVPANWRGGLVVFAHGIDGETRERTFDDLVAWIERGVRPAGEDVLAPDLSRIGLKWTPALHLEDPLTTRR